MSRLQEILDASASAGDVPFVVAMVGDSKGIRWTGAAGDCAPGRLASINTVFRIYSMTKAVGSAAAMILIDRGKLDPESLVEDIIPEFAKIQVLDRLDDEPVLRAPKVKATVRHLATHTSGLEYEFWNDTISKYLAKKEIPSVLSGQKAGLFYPMTSDPGTRWAYGPGIDWLGQVVERVDGRRIDQFCCEEIFEPLGMSDTMFEVDGKIAPRLASPSARGDDGRFAPFDLAPPSKPEFYGMGHALYSTAPDYMNFLRMFLNDGTLNGRRVLSESAVTWMLEDQSQGLAFNKMTTAAPVLTADFNPFPGTPKSNSFGALMVKQNVPGMRSAGSQSWAGVLNTHFWFDRRKDVAAIIMTQSLPFVEPRFMDVYARFERAVYATL